MQLKYTYGARSMLDQLGDHDLADAEAEINRIHVGLNNNVRPQNLMERVSSSATSDVYVTRIGDGWHIYVKVSKDQLSIEDVVSKRQLEALRMSH